MFLIKFLNSKVHLNLIRLKLSSSKIKSSSLRNNSTNSKNKITSENEQLVQKLINESGEQSTLPKNEILVYEGQLTPNVRRIKIFSLSTTFLGLVCYPFMFKKASNSNKSALAHVFVGWTLIMVIFSPLALNYITKRYITELRFNKNTKTFRAITLNLFMRQIETKFKQDDVVVPMIPGLFTSFTVNKKPLFMDPAYVLDIKAYQHLLGHDKPTKETNKTTK